MVVARTPKSEKRFTTNQDPDMLYISFTWNKDFIYCAYQVRVAHVVHLCFNWNLYGGEEQALTAAKKFRDALLPWIGTLGKAYNGNLLSGRNATGAVGVSFELQHGKYRYCLAQWTDREGRRRKKTFSVTKWGEEKALQLAIEAREKGAGMYPAEVLEEAARLKQEVKKEQTEMRRTR